MEHIAFVQEGTEAILAARSEVRLRTRPHIHDAKQEVRLICEYRNERRMIMRVQQISADRLQHAGSHIA